MWNINKQKAHYFRNNHSNLFPPRERPLSDVEEEEEDDLKKSVLDNAQLDQRNSAQEKEIFSKTTHAVESSGFVYTGHSLFDPVAISPLNGPGGQRETQETTAKRYQSSPGNCREESSSSFNRKTPKIIIPPASVQFPIFNPPTAQLPPFMFPVHDTSHSPVATVTRLLQDVLGVMDMIMSEHGSVEEESQILLELVELAAIMQDEAEALVELVDLVDEYTEEADTVAGLEEWMQDLEGGRNLSPSKIRHRRDDSGISMGERFECEIYTPTDRYAVHEELRKVWEAIEETAEETSEVIKVPQLSAHRPKRMQKKGEAHFRDSALDLQSPVVKRSLSNRSLR